MSRNEPTLADLPGMFKDEVALLPGQVAKIPDKVANIPDKIADIPNKIESGVFEAQNAVLNNVLFALSILLVVPLAISYKYQPKLVSMILTSAIFYINIYHYSHEQKFFVMDFVWSSILTFTSLVILYLGYVKYGLTAKIVIGGVIGVVALYIYLFYGYFPDDVKNPRSVNGYLKYHAMWHILGFISLCIIMTIRVDLSKIIVHGH